MCPLCSFWLLDHLCCHSSLWYFFSYSEGLHLPFLLISSSGRWIRIYYFSFSGPPFLLVNPVVVSSLLLAVLLCYPTLLPPPNIDHRFSFTFRYRLVSYFL